MTRTQRSSWVFGLMQPKMETPTPALDRLVREAIRPRVDYATRLIAELMHADPEDPRVRAVNASVHGITLLLLRAPVVTRLLPAWRPTPEALESFAQLITRFALAGIRELAGPGRGAR